jgi:hypothetical protein
MSAATADPVVLHKLIAVGWVPQAVEEVASLRLQVALLTGQRDDLMCELVEVTARAVAAERREEARLEARLVARPRPSRLVAWLGMLCLFIDAVWSQDMEVRA